MPKAEVTQHIRTCRFLLPATPTNLPDSTFLITTMSIFQSYFSIPSFIIFTLSNTIRFIISFIMLSFSFNKKNFTKHQSFSKLYKTSVILKTLQTSVILKTLQNISHSQNSTNISHSQNSNK